MSHSFVLLQARKANDPSKLDEHRAFADRLGIPTSDIQSVCILTEELGPNILEGKDALFVGGAGEFSVLDDNDRIRRLIDFLAWIADLGFPTFASCFGFQAIVLGLGGEVVADEANAEVGSYTLDLLPPGRANPLFSVLSDRFLAQLGHKDRASRLPSSLINFAKSERAPFQAVQVKDKPVFATQFHPELTGEGNRRRFAAYIDQYGQLFGKEEAERKLNSHRASLEANSLLKRFVDVCVNREIS